MTIFCVTLMSRGLGRVERLVLEVLEVNKAENFAWYQHGIAKKLEKEHGVKQPATRRAIATLAEKNLVSAVKHGALRFVVLSGQEAPASWDWSNFKVWVLGIFEKAAKPLTVDEILDYVYRDKCPPHDPIYDYHARSLRLRVLAELRTLRKEGVLEACNYGLGIEYSCKSLLPH